jgi:hypothetical protein
MRGCERDKARQVAQIVLAVGVHLQHVAEALTLGGSGARHDRAALALVDGQAQQGHPARARPADPLESRAASRGAAVVHHETREPGCFQRIEHTKDGRFVVEHRNHDGDRERRRLPDR